MSDLVYPQTRGERPPDFERKLQYTRALMRLAAEDPETDRILFEVRSLLRRQSALSEPRLASRVQAMMASAQAATHAFRPGEPSAGGFDLERTSNELIAAE